MSFVRVYPALNELCLLCKMDGPLTLRGACAELLIAGGPFTRQVPVCYQHAQEVANWLVEAAEQLLELSEATRVAVPTK